MLQLSHVLILHDREGLDIEVAFEVDGGGRDDDDGGGRDDDDGGG